jgi:signal transduction histidine kinase
MIEQVDVVKLIQGYLTPLRESLREKSIRCDLKAEPDLSPISGDRLLLKQCFQNLIHNSIEAMPDGGELSIGIGETEAPSGEKSAVVEISDTGCGIAKEDQHQIFNPFFTLREQGTGLGLSLVKKIVTLHSGKIEVESEPPRGSTFRIVLPSKSRIRLEEAKGEKTADLESPPCTA